jgi:dihydrofolate reductase
MASPFVAANPRPLISALVVMTRTRGIAYQGAIPSQLSISDDRRRFKNLTMGHALVMGRKTWASLSRPLVGRKNFILTRDPDFSASCATVIHGKLGDAIFSAIDHERNHFGSDGQEVFIIGGGEIYELAFPLIQRLYLTIVDTYVRCDTFFPEYAARFTEEVTPFTTRGLCRGSLTYSFVTLEKPRL